MLKFNNQTQPPLLPRIINGYLIPFSDIFPRETSNSHKKTPRTERRKSLRSKQNCLVKIRDRITLNVQFPIGRNKNKQTSLSKVSQTTDLKQYDQIVSQAQINDDDVFASRRAYSILKKDIKTKMMKYNGDRQQLLTDRSHQSKDILQHVNLNQFHNMEYGMAKTCKKRNFYASKLNTKTIHNNFQNIQNITDWNDIKASNYEDSRDFFLEEVVAESLKSQRHQKL